MGGVAAVDFWKGDAMNKKTGYDLYLETHIAGAEPELHVVYEAEQIVAFEDIKAGRPARSHEDFTAELAAFTSFAPGSV